MALSYRKAQEADLPRAESLVAKSINEVLTRHGFKPFAAASAPLFQTFCLAEAPDGLWVAEDAGEIVGFAWSWACEELWFLAQLFVSPDRQGKGIGDTLIAKTFDHAKRCGSKSRALITFAFNPSSQGLYLRHGLFPRFPIYNFTGDAKRVEKCLQGGHLDVVPLSGPSDLGIINEIDEASLGVSRIEHHRFLMNSGVTNGMLLRSGKRCVGYAYVNSSGHIGPLAVGTAADMTEALRTAIRVAIVADVSAVSAFLPASSPDSLQVAVESGMRITVPMLLMSDVSLGDWSKYLPRNPGYM